MTLQASTICDGMTVLTALIVKEEDMYIAKCPEIGTASQGSTIEEAVSNLKEATSLYLEEFPKKSASKPIITTFEVKLLGPAEKNFRKRLR